MTTEHVSVPRKVYENLAQIAEGKMSKHNMQDLAAEAYNILSRATPSDVSESWEKAVKDHAVVTECVTWEGKKPWDVINDVILYHIGVAEFQMQEKHSAPRVVTDADVERACSAYYGRGIYAKWENFDEFAKASQREYMRAALESFVNGGSNE